MPGTRTIVRRVKQPVEKEPTFEAALETLEGLVATMETGETPLEEMVARFQEGHRLLTLCTRKLRSAEQTLAVLRQDRKGIALEKLETETL